MKDKVLVDTSIWINYLKGQKSQFSDKVDEILTSSVIIVPKVAIAELIKGAKSEKEIKAIEQLLEAFHIIDSTRNTWIKAGKLSFSLKRSGITINLVDCYIAILSIENNCKIFSIDEHFSVIKDFIKIELI